MKGFSDCSQLPHAPHPCREAKVRRHAQELYHEYIETASHVERGWTERQRLAADGLDRSIGAVDDAGNRHALYQRSELDRHRLRIRRGAVGIAGRWVGTCRAVCRREAPGAGHRGRDPRRFPHPLGQCGRRSDRQRAGVGKPRLYPAGICRVLERRAVPPSPGADALDPGAYCHGAAYAWDCCPLYHAGSRGRVGCSCILHVAVGHGSRLFPRRLTARLSSTAHSPGPGPAAAGTGSRGSGRLSGRRSFRDASGAGTLRPPCARRKCRNRTVRERGRSWHRCRTDRRVRAFAGPGGTTRIRQGGPTGTARPDRSCARVRRRNGRPRWRA